MRRPNFTSAGLTITTTSRTDLIQKSDPVAPLTHNDFRSDARREQYFLVPQAYPPTPPPQHYDSDEEYDPYPPHKNFAQTIVEVISAEQHDTTGIHPRKWSNDDHSRPTPPINLPSLARKHPTRNPWNFHPLREHHGDRTSGRTWLYRVVIPAICRTRPIPHSTHMRTRYHRRWILRNLHTTQHNTTPSSQIDNGAAYTLHAHRDPTSREWRVPLDILE